MEAISDPRIKKENIIAAVQRGARSPTAVAKLLGFKSGSSSIIKRLLVAVPDLRERLILAEADKAKEVAVTDTPVSTLVNPSLSNTAAYPIPDFVPFRAASGYAMVWSILYAFRETGISKSELMKRYQAWSGKPDKNCGFDCHVVASSREDGSSHRSASKAACCYWVERKGDLLKMHLVGVN